MNRRLRILIIAGACVVLAFVVATLGYAFTSGGGPHKPRYPGRLTRSGTAAGSDTCSSTRATRG
jgi:hypothetical protein